MMNLLNRNHAIMKKAIYLSMLAVCGLVACSKAEQDAPVVEEPVVNPVTSRTVTLIASSSLSDNDTKAVFTDGTGFAWETADLTNVGISQSGSNVCTKTGGSIDANGNAILKADVADGNFYAYFPYNSSAAGSFEMAASQTTAAGAFSGIKLASDEIAISSETTEASVKFHVVGHLLRFFIYDEAGSTEKVQKIDVNASCPLSGTYAYNFASKTGSPSSTAQQVEVSLSADYDLSGITAALDAESVFVSVLPGTTSWIDYVVTTDQNIYTFHSTSARTFAEGAVTEVKLNLQKATTVTPVSSKIGLTYHFTDKGVAYSGFTQDVPSGGVTNKDLGWFIVALDGVENTTYTAEYYTDITSSAVDGESNPATWVRAFKGGNNNLFFTCDPNESTTARTATLSVYFNETADYVVVGRVANSEKTVENISGTDPIAVITVTQAAAPANLSIEFKFTTSGGSPVPASSYDLPKNNAHQTYGRFQTYVNESIVTSNSDAVLGALRFQLDDGAIGAEANNGWIRAYRYSGSTGDLNFEVQANASDERSAVLKVYLSGDYYDTYTVTSDGVTISDENTPIYTATITQAGSTGKAKVIYDFYTIDWSTMQQLFNNPATSYPNSPSFEGSSITAAGGTVHSGGQYRVSVDGAWNTNWTGLSITGDAVDGDSNTVDWVSNVTITGGKVYFTLSANETGAPRSATVRWFAVDAETNYQVIGTYYSANPERAGNGMAATVKTITSADPIFELSITQPGA